MSIRQKKLPIAVLERIDDVCAQFERQCRSNQAPAIESLIQGDFSEFEREVLLAELVALEFDYRQRRGESPTPQEYLDRFPKDTQVIRDALSDSVQPARPFEPPSIQRVGELFPNLQISELLGAGGMGAVYKAKQEGLDRVVALKILPEEFGHDVKSALRFTREARTLAKLNHPNIVSVFEFGNVKDTYYFLMEFVDGSTLREIVAAKQLAPEHALAIVPHLCDALQYAHDQGVVHRDIKPENILMSVDGSVKIADFGLSRILEDDLHPTTLTATHQVMGTPRYMAPEQLEGARGVDHRADIYSLGVVFYEMLTGELPIGRFAAPSQKVEIDVRLDEVVLRSLEKEPRRRYQQASQIKSDVQSITSSENPQLAPTIAWERDPETAAASTSSSVEEQELAGRLLITRRQLMDRVRNSLRPLIRGQVVLILLGIAIIIIGALCWTQNIHVPHRLASGVILHVYGLMFIVAAANVLTRIHRIDYSEPVDEIRSKLDSLTKVYLTVGPLIGFPWWLMWIPLCVAVGFDAVLYWSSLIVSLVVGIIGISISLWLYLRALRVGKANSESRRHKLAGRSIARAYQELSEIEQANIR